MPESDAKTVELDEGKELLSVAGRSFVRAFAASLIVLLPGILSAPTLTGAKGLGIAAVIASIAAGLRAIQGYVEHLSLERYFKDASWHKFLPYADSFIRGFLAAGITSFIGILSMPSLSAAKSAVVGALVGAIAAGIKAISENVPGPAAAHRLAGHAG